MPETVFGLPIHPLIVHATVVVVPTAALVLVLAVLLPRFRAWAGPLPAGARRCGGGSVPAVDQHR